MKHLELVACVDDGITLGACALLLRQSPSLWRFTLKVNILWQSKILQNIRDLTLFIVHQARYKKLESSYI